MRLFPIRSRVVCGIPWDLIAPHEPQALRNHSQTLERLAERGGLSPAEALCVLGDRSWDGPTFLLPRHQAGRDAYVAERETELRDLVVRWQAERPAGAATVTQPAPRPGEGDVWRQVIADMEARRLVGLERYGRPVQPFNGRDALVDAYQEALDLAVYLRQAIAERDGARRKPDRVPATNDRPHTLCHAARDGECGHPECPQARDGEPQKSGRHCPLDVCDGCHWCVP